MKDDLSRRICTVHLMASLCSHYYGFCSVKEENKEKNKKSRQETQDNKGIGVCALLKCYAA